MPERQRVYCGKKQVLPDGYDRFAIPYQCLKKGYGACLYANRYGQRRPFFHRFSSRLLFMLLVVALFGVLLYSLQRYFRER